MPDDLTALLERIGGLDRASKQQIFEIIKHEVAVHKLEEHFGISVQIICEAILRAGDLTQRGIRGVIAETVFSIDILPSILGWRDITPPGDLPYDALLQNDNRQVRIQVKLQRRERGVPLMRSRTRNGPKDFYIVEVQRTRTGNRDGELTRPYRFNEFDLLAVCMQPSTGNWHDFLYTSTRTLTPKKDRGTGSLILSGGQEVIETLQLVPPYPGDLDDNWTNDIETALQYP
ncbi:MAG TPA: hypothetical protein VG651_04585 [Stellaceae bacterium]|nr:hypothetical protein [Stellaceae bacterium]